MVIRMKTLGKARLMVPKIIVIDGKMYRPSAPKTLVRDNIYSSEVTLKLEEIVSEDEK